MIILFFFLINFKFSADEIKAEASAQIEEAVAQSEQLAEDKLKFDKEKEEWQNEADSEMEKIREADKNAADNAEALMNFQKGFFLKIDLQMSSKNDWNITILNGDVKIGEIFSKDSHDITNEIIAILDNNGYKKDEVIIALFKYNLHDNGSGIIPEKFYPKINALNGVYKNFYCAEDRK